MNILQLYSGQSTETGDFIYRIKRTTDGLSLVPGIVAEYADLVDANPELVQDVPLLILHHLSDPDVLPVISERKRRGLPTVYELADNFRFSHAHKPEFRRLGPPAYTVIIDEFIRRCDAIQVNNVTLKACCTGLNDRFIIVPNFVEACSARRTEGHDGRLTVGWGGSARHVEDMRQYASVLIRWVQQNPNVRFGVMGAKSIQRLFAELPSEQVFFRDPGSLEAYFSFLAELDIGLAPLTPSEFNTCRSDVKYLEYACMGVAPVCSRYGPYAELGRPDETIVHFSDSDELIARLEALRLVPALRKRVAIGAHDWVRSNRVSEVRHWQGIVAAYEALSPGIFQQGSSACLPVTRASSPEVSNLIKQAVSAARADQALSGIRALIGSNFQNYHIHFFYGWALWRSGKQEQAFASIRKALEIRPDSIHSLEFAARLYILNGDFEAAGKMIASALQAEPELPTLLAVEAQILQLKGQHMNAIYVLEKCIRKAPQFVDALMAYVQSAILLKKSALAEGKLQTLAALIPDSAEVHFYSAVIAHAGGRFDQCENCLRTALELQPDHEKSKMLLERLQESGVPA